MSPLADRAVVGGYRAGAALARRLPARAVEPTSRLLGRVLARVMPARRRMVARHLRRVQGPDLTEPDLERQVALAFASYARYYVESFRLPRMAAAEIDAGMTLEGIGGVWRTLDGDGRGAILALPHMGGWDWGAFWLTACRGRKVSAVVEPLRPPGLFEWFAGFRESLGMRVIPLGPAAGQEVLAALDRNEIVCLVADRDLTGGGPAVSFFGEETTLPGGPVLLGLRSGAPVFPAAVYYEPDGGHLGVVHEPLTLDRRGRLRADVARHTQTLAGEFEGFIRRAPEQWHLFQPNWPSDHRWLEARWP